MLSKTKSSIKNKILPKSNLKKTSVKSTLKELPTVKKAVPRSFSEKTKPIQIEKTKSDSNSLHKKKNTKPAKAILTKRERRSLKIDAKKHSEITRSILSKWEILRREDTPKERKYELVDQMLKSSNSVLNELCFAHDTSRVVESMIQYGTERQRYEVFILVKPKILEMSETHFGRFVVKKMISYCAKDQLSELIKMVSGSVAKLLSHKYSCEIVELLFNDHANSKQRSQMLQELYGNRDLLNLNNFDNIYTLSDVLQINKDKSQVILKNLNEHLIKLISKNLTNMSIIQRLFLEYITSEVPFLGSMLPGNQRAESVVPTDFKLLERVQLLLDTFVEHNQIVPMLHTREGLRGALCLLWLSNPKTKKGILKSLKTAIASIAVNEHGYLFICGLFDFVDDVVLLEKTVIKEILEDLDLLVSHPYGRKTLLYTLCPRERIHFQPQIISSLFAPGDKSPYTRKSLGIRAFELRSVSIGLLPALLRLAAEKMVQLFVGDRVENFQPVLDRGRLILLIEILNQSSQKALTPSICLDNYQRTHKIAPEKSNLQELTTMEKDLISGLRKEVLHQFVKICLSPEFVPSGKQLPKIEDKSQAKKERKRKALAVAEEESIKRRKISVQAFSNMGDKKSVRLDHDQEDETETNQAIDTNKLQIQSRLELNYEDEILLEMPWIERPEAPTVINSLIENCKKSECYDFLDVVIELVPEKVLRSWTSCNRTCFYLVKMYEAGYAPMCSYLKTKVSNAKLISMLKKSDLPGAQALLKKLA